MKIRPIAMAAAVVFAFALAGCDPKAGDKCNSPGEFYTHSQDGKRVSLTCSPSGVSPNGKQEYRWVKS